MMRRRSLGTMAGVALPLPEAPRMARRRRLVMKCAFMLAGMSDVGCSFMLTKGPPVEHARLWHFDCSTSYAPPVLDTIWAGLNGLGMAVALSTSEADWKRTQNNDQSTTAMVGLVWLAVSGSSAIYGYKTVNDCNQAKERYHPRYPAPDATPPARSLLILPRPSVPPAPAAPPVPPTAPLPTLGPPSTPS
jgi:hypothetical protein